MLYGISYTLKFMSKQRPENPVDYTVMALEGLWWEEDGRFDITNPGKGHWTTMITQPDHITFVLGMEVKKMTTQEQRTQEERLLAALAHAAIVTGAIAPVAGILIYLTQKEKSAYAAGQALQAAVYQLLGLLVIIIAWSCWGAFYALTFIPLIRNAEQYQDAPPPIFWIGLGSMIIPFIVMGLWGLYGLYGALRAWAGADFRYAVVGRLVTEKLTLQQESAKG